jgi:Ca-activated chloride channel family protein
MDRTQQMGPLNDPQRTQAMQMPVLDPSRTQAVPNLMGAPAQPSLSMEVVLGRPYALAQSIAREGLLVVIRAVQTAMGRAPLNLCLVLDRSGSMEGAPFEYAKQACAYLVDQLTEQDVLSIVTFSDAVDVVMPPRKIVNKQLVKDHIMRLTVGDTTNIYDALVVGTQQVTSVNLPGYQTHLILLTDGEPTVGIKDFSTIVGVAARAKEFGFHITALGFGPDYNEELLAGIARRSGGKYYYIDQPQRIPEVFQQELVRLMTVVARNPKLEVQLSRWVQVRQAFGGELKLQGRTATLSLVDVERGSTLTPVLELEFPNHPAGIYRIAKLTLSWEDIVTGARRDSNYRRRAGVHDRPRAGKSAARLARRERTAGRRCVPRAGKDDYGHARPPARSHTGVSGVAAHAGDAAQSRTPPGGAGGHPSDSRLQSQDANTAEKTLMGTLVNLEQGKREGGA